MNTKDWIHALEDQNDKVWSRTAPTYATAAEVMSGLAIEPLLDAAGVGRGTKLLDVGTGPGTVVGPALRRGATVVAVDACQAMVEAARARHPGVDIRVASAAELPFPPQSFDAVSLGFCLLVLPEPARALREARRVLRPGGRVALTSWAPSGLEAMAVGGAAVADFDMPAPDFSRAPLFGVESPVLADALSDAGFEQPFARTLDLVVNVTSPDPLVEHFARVLDLDSYGSDLRTRLAQRLETELAGRRDKDGVARLSNPAILALARAPTQNRTQHP
jgi:ubiquinone/menaquinone biosynthesis C-methylase UbiE